MNIIYFFNKKILILLTLSLLVTLFFIVDITRNRQKIKLSYKIENIGVVGGGGELVIDITDKADKNITPIIEKFNGDSANGIIELNTNKIEKKIEIHLKTKSENEFKVALKTINTNIELVVNGNYKNGEKLLEYNSSLQDKSLKGKYEISLIQRYSIMYAPIIFLLSFIIMWLCCIELKDTTSNSSKIKNIELLRVIFALGIMFGHYGIGVDPSLGTNLLFILGGFFFYITSLNENLTTKDFIIKKLIRLYPLYFLFCIFCGFSLSIYGKIIDIFMFNSLIPTANIPVEWYVQHLFCVQLFLFYFLKCFGRKRTNLFIALMSYFSLVLLNKDYSGYLQAWDVWRNYKFTYTFDKNYYFLPTFFRAFLFMGSGYFIGVIFENFKIPSLKNAVSNFILNLLEVLLFSFIVFRVVLNGNLGYQDTLIYLITASTLIYLFLNNKGIISNFFNNNISVALGKYCYALYLCHLLLNKIVYIQNPLLRSGVAIIFSVAVYHLIEKPISEYLYKKIYEK